MQHIEAKGLLKKFGDKIAVDHVDLTVAKGEVVGFLGPNGAGKSTTMKMIAGFLEPDDGSAAICGHDIQAYPKMAKQHLGYLPEGAPAYSDMVVADFLGFVGQMRGLSGTELNNRLADMAEVINLTEVWDQRIENLSKGFKRRVGIAQALIHDPDVLILDEPTDGLDPNQKHEMRSLIRSISEEKAIVISTHILEEVEAVCTRAVIISEGQVLADRDPASLMAEAAPENTIRVKVLVDGDPDIVSRVAKVTGKADLEVIGQTNGSAAILIKPNGKAAQPAQIASRLHREKIRVEEIGYYRPGLEDVFRQITQGTNH